MANIKHSFNKEQEVAKYLLNTETQGDLKYFSHRVNYNILGLLILLTLVIQDPISVPKIFFSKHLLLPSIQILQVTIVKRAKILIIFRIPLLQNLMKGILKLLNRHPNHLQFA